MAMKTFAGLLALAGIASAADFGAMRVSTNSDVVSMKGYVWSHEIFGPTIHHGAIDTVEETEEEINGSDGCTIKWQGHGNHDGLLQKMADYMRKLAHEGKILGREDEIRSWDPCKSGRDTCIGGYTKVPGDLTKVPKTLTIYAEDDADADIGELTYTINCPMDAEPGCEFCAALQSSAGQIAGSVIGELFPGGTTAVTAGTEVSCSGC